MTITLYFIAVIIVYDVDKNMLFPMNFLFYLVFSFYILN